MKRLLILIIIFSGLAMAQINDFTRQLYYGYENFKESRLSKKRFRHEDILPLIGKLKNNPVFNVSTAGSSALGKDIYLVTAGSGPVKVFMWSQMHGDEPTATMALFDLFNFLSANDQYNETRERILRNTTLYFMPMVNPDGAELYRRRNTFDIDINRDAARNTTPEGRVLKDIFDYLKADFGFNLHDQSIYYSAGRSHRSAAVSFLAPAPDYSKTTDSVRLNAIKLISEMHEVISEFIPGHIGKYDDEHEPRAFGDNFQKWGTSTILIETGGWRNDPEKQFLRKVNFLLFCSALLSIADKTYRNADISVYDKIPLNIELLKDLIIRNVTYREHGTELTIDVSVDRLERPVNNNLIYHSVIDDIGDLSVYYGYEDYDFTGYEIHPGRMYGHPVKSSSKLSESFMNDLLKEGYTGIIYTGNTKTLNGRYTVNITKDRSLKNDISIGSTANFYLTKNGIIEYVFVNGFMYDVKNRINKIKNSYIAR